MHREPTERHLHVDDVRANLKARALRSGASVIAAQLATALIALGTVAILARLLNPADFGLVAMALPVVIIASALHNFGLDLGAIQREDLDHGLANALFWVALRLNLTLAIVLAASAPVLVWLYGEPRLLGITLAFAGAVLGLSLGAQHETLLKRQMRFELLSIINLIGAAAGAIVAVALALAGAGYWALVAQTGLALVVRGLLVWVKCEWRPHWPPEFSKARALPPELRAYGRALTKTRLLNLISGYIDRVTIGWLAGPALLGFYDNGRRLAFFSVDAIYPPLLDVAVAGLSRTAESEVRYRVHAGKAVQLVLALILPGLAFLFLEMRPVTEVLLGQRWSPAVPFARLLVLAAFAQSLTRTLMWFYLSRDETARQLRWSAVQTVVMASAIALGAWRGGAYGAAIGFTAANWALVIPAIVYALHASPFSARDFAAASARPVLLSFVATAVLFAIETIAFRSWPSFMHCAAAALTFELVYALGWLALPRGREESSQMIQLLTNAVRR